MRLFLVAFLVGITVFGFSQGNGDFRSRQSGNWNQSASWEEFIAGTWQVTVNTPTSANGTITIRNGHTITVTAAVTTDRTIVDVGATLSVNDAVTLTLAADPSNSLTINGTLIMAGESFLSGTGNVAIAGTLRLGSLNGTGAIVTGTTLGNIRVNRGFITGSTIVYAGTGPQFIGDGTPATAGVHTVIDNPSGVSLNNIASTLVTITGNLTLLQGNLTAQNNNLTVNSATGTTTVNSGNLNMTSGAVARTFTARNIVLSGGNINITSGNATTTCTVNGNLTLTSGNFTINSSNFISTLTLSGALGLNGGTLAINSLAENATLNVNGDITGTSFVTFSGNNSNLNINGNGQLSRDFPLNAATTLEALIVDRLNCTVVIPQNLLVTRSVRITRGNIDMNAALTINTNLDINAGGTLFFENQPVSISGTFNSIGGYTGVLSANANSTLNIVGAGVFNTLVFSGAGNTLGTLLLNRTTGGTLVTLNSTLTIANSLYLQDGMFNNISGLNMALGAAITLNSNASLSGAAPGGGPYDLIYEGASLSTQLEAQGSLQDVTNNSTGTVSITTAIAVPGNLTLNSGTLSNASGLLTMGNGATLIRNGSATFGGLAPSGGPYNLIYNGTTYSAGIEVGGALNDVTSNLTGTLTLTSALTSTGTLLIASGTMTSGANAVAAALLQNQATFNAPSVNLTLTGNLVNNGTFNAGTGTVIFNGTSTLSGANINTTNFNNITVNPAASLTPSATLSILGNFTNNGSFVAGSGTVAFAGSVGLKVLSGSTNTQFNNLTLNKNNGGVSLTVSSPQTVTNTLTVTSGQLSITASNLSLSNGATLIKNSAGTILTSSPAGGPWHLIYQGGSQNTSLEIPAAGAVETLTVSTSNGAVITLSQNLTVNGLFSNPLAGRIFTSGANNVTVGSFSNAGTFNAPGSTATTGLTVSGSFTNDGTFTHNSGTLVIAGAVTLSGTAINGTNFNHITINGAATLTPSSTLNVQGNFTNNGGFNPLTGTVNFSGTVGARVLSGTTNTAFYDVVLNKSNVGASVTVNSPQTITNSLTLTAGQLDIIAGNLSLNNLSTLTRASGSISTTSPSGGPWNLVYTGGNKTAGLEIPASGVETLTVNTNNSTTVTLNQNLIVNGLLTILASGRSFTTGNFNVTVGSFSNTGTFNAPSASAVTGFTITGNFVNNGTFAPSNGTVFINGPVTMSGTAINTTIFNNLSILGPGTLTPATVLNVSGNFTNDGVFNGGTGNVEFTGNVGAKVLSGTTNTQFYNLTLNKTNVGLSLTVGSAQTVTNALTLSAGQISIPTSNLSLSTGITLTRNSGASVSTGSPGGGPWNLIYIGGNLTTGLEIPVTNLENLTVNSNSGSVVTLSTIVSITNSLTVNAQAVGPTFTAGAQAINAGSLVNFGIFNAPTPATGLLTLTGDLTNNGTFNRGTGTVVFAGNSQILGTNNPTLHHIRITETLTSPAASLLLTGNFTNNGTFAALNGIVNFNGTSTQDIDGSSTTSFGNITVNNIGGPPGVRVQSNQNLRGVLTLAAGAQFDADGSTNTRVFTVVSLGDDPTEDGSIAAIPATSLVTGSVRVRRFMGAEGSVNRYLSSPVSNATVDDFADDFDPLGLRYYDETVQGGISEGYINTGDFDVLAPGRGYLAFMWDGSSNITWDLSGPLTATLNQGSVNLNVTHTVSAPAEPDADGWNLVGNPYPSGIVWTNDISQWTKTDIAPVIYVPDIANNVYHTWHAGTQTGDLPGGIITTGQAFWVYANQPGASLIVHEPAKTMASGTFYRARPQKTAGLMLSLTHQKVTDNSFIIINENTTPAYDKDFDAPKLEGILSIAIVDDKNRKLVSYSTNEAGLDHDIPLSVSGEKEGEYEIGITALSDFDSFDQLYLVDAYLGKSTKMSEAGVYKFTLTGNSETRKNRFFITKTPNQLLSGENNIIISLYPNPVSSVLNIEVNNENASSALLMDNMGRVIERIDLKRERGLSVGSTDVSHRSAGFYFVKVLVNGQSAIRKLVKH